jgi:hypothetical protein
MRRIGPLVGLLVLCLALPCAAAQAKKPKEPITMELLAEGAPLTGVFVMHGVYTVTLPFTGNVVRCEVTSEPAIREGESGPTTFLQFGYFDGEGREPAALKEPCGEGSLSSNDRPVYGNGTYQPNKRKLNYVGFSPLVLDFYYSAAEDNCSWEFIHMQPPTPSSSGVFTASGLVKVRARKHTEVPLSSECSRHLPTVELSVTFTTLGGAPVEVLVG